MQSAGSCSPDGSGTSEGSSSGLPRVASANQLALGQAGLTLGSSAPDLGMGGGYRYKLWQVWSSSGCKSNLASLQSHHVLHTDSLC